MKNNGQTQREEADRLFCARIADMARQQQRDNLPCFTRFLDEREQRLAAIGCTVAVGRGDFPA